MWGLILKSGGFFCRVRQAGAGNAQEGKLLVAGRGRVGQRFSINVEGVSEARGEAIPPPLLDLLYNLRVFIRFDLEGRVDLLKRKASHRSWGMRGVRAVWAARGVGNACVTFSFTCCSSVSVARVWPDESVRERVL